MKGERHFRIARLIIEDIYDHKYDIKYRSELYAKYISHIRKSAYLGNAMAQFELAQFYEDINSLGSNRNYNPKKCNYWYSKACENDHAEACNNLAYHYEKGIGVKRNLNKSLRLYKKSSKLGSKFGHSNFLLSRK